MLLLFVTVADGRATCVIDYGEFGPHENLIKIIASTKEIIYIHTYVYFYLSSLGSIENAQFSQCLIIVGIYGASQTALGSTLVSF